ncbi:MAG TPA: lysozyme inhibitor LprI family protein [Acidimicrobiales bacterium]|nr:lysozyme inhibitor LprI family protein [Acidimicrobiales bacterium]
MATSVLALLAMTGARGPTPPPQAPVVTAPPSDVTDCSQQSQIGLDGCAYQRDLAADKLLNADIRVIWSLLRPSQREAFVNAQSAWVKYQGADCESQSGVYAGGTAQPMEYLLCLAGDAASRRQDLRGFYLLLAQGTSSSPKFP